MKKTLFLILTLIFLSSCNHSLKLSSKYYTTINYFHEIKRFNELELAHFKQKSELTISDVYKVFGSGNSYSGSNIIFWQTGDYKIEANKNQSPEDKVKFIGIPE